MKPQTKVRLARKYMLKEGRQPGEVDEHIISHGLWETIGLEIKNGEEIFTLRCIMPTHKDRKLNEEIRMFSKMIAVLCDEIEWVRKDITPEEYKK